MKSARGFFEVGRFLLASGFNTVATFVLYVALLQLVNYSVAYTIAYVTGIVIAYLLNARFVFRTALTRSSAIRFPFVYVVQYLIGLGVLRLLVERLAIRPVFASVLLVMITTPVTFCLTRYVLRSGSRNVATRLEQSRRTFRDGV